MSLSMLLFYLHVVVKVCLSLLWSCMHGLLTKVSPSLQFTCPRVKACSCTCCSCWHLSLLGCAHGKNVHCCGGIMWWETVMGLFQLVHFWAIERFPILAPGSSKRLSRGEPIVSCKVARIRSSCLCLAHRVYFEIRWEFSVASFCCWLGELAITLQRQWSSSGW